MKQADFEPCAVCGKGMMAHGDLSFLRVRIEQMVIDPGAVSRAHGLEMAIGPLARALGPDETLAQRMAAHAGLICQHCALYGTIEPFALMGAMEAAEDARREGQSPPSPTPPEGCRASDGRPDDPFNGQCAIDDVPRK